MSDARKKHAKPAAAHAPAAPQPTTAGEKASWWIPWPPVIYVVAIVVSLLLHAFYPLPWFGSPVTLVE